MIDTTKLYKMIKVMGKMDLKSLSERFPSETIESLRAVIEKTDNLEIIGSYVRIKEGDAKQNHKENAVLEKIKVTPSVEKTVTGETEVIRTNIEENVIEESIVEEVSIQESIVEENVTEEVIVAETEEVASLSSITATGEACVNAPINHVTTQNNVQSRSVVTSAGINPQPSVNANIIQLRDVSKKIPTKVENELTYDKIMDLINQYNEKIENELHDLMGDPETRREEAIYEYLAERYIVEPYKQYPMATIYSQFDKRTNTMRGYAVIVQDLTEEVFNLVDSLFDMEMVFIYYANENHIGMPSTTKEIYLRPANVIIDEYMINYEIKKIPVELSKIIKISNGEVNELN